MLSHNHKQNLVPAKGEALSGTAALKPRGRTSPGIERGCTGGAAPGGAADMMQGSAAAEAVESRDEPVSVERSQQDRRERAGVGAGAFPRRAAAARLRRALRHSRTGP